MKVIIVGGGTVGMNVARVLTREKHDITLIERDQQRRSSLQSDLDILTIQANGSSPQVLDKAGAADADLLIAATNIDEVNLVACSYAKSLGVAQTIARIHSPDHLDATGAAALGADHLINPEEAAAHELERLLEHTWAVDVADFADGLVEMMAIRLNADDEIVGQSIAEIGGLEISRSTVVAAILRGSEFIVPHGKTVVQEGDVVYVIGRKGAMSAVSFLCGHPDEGIDKVAIYGGTRLGTRLAKSLESRKIKVILIEEDPARAAECAEVLDKTLVINIGGTNARLLRSEGVDTADGFVSVSEDNETNLLSAALVHRFGVPKTVAHIERQDYAHLAIEMGIDATVSTTSATADAILRFLRKGKLRTVTTISGGAGEIYELVIPENSRITGIPFASLKLPEGILVGALVDAKGNVEIPRGGSVMRAGQTAVIIIPADAVKTVESLFADTGGKS